MKLSVRNKRRINMASEQALQEAARAWCTPETEKITMDPVLAVAFADIIDSYIKGED